MSDSILIVQALEEAIELLTEENQRLRNNNRILRIVNSGLRSKMAIAHRNDEEFRSACQEDILPEVDEIIAPVYNTGYTVPGFSGSNQIPFLSAFTIVQPLVIDSEPESDATGFVDKAAPDSIEYKTYDGPRQLGPNYETT